MLLILSGKMADQQQCQEYLDLVYEVKSRMVILDQEGSALVFLKLEKYSLSSYTQNIFEQNPAIDDKNGPG